MVTIPVLLPLFGVMDVITGEWAVMVKAEGSVPDLESGSSP